MVILTLLSSLTAIKRKKIQWSSLVAQWGVSVSEMICLYGLNLNRLAELHRSILLLSSTMEDEEFGLAGVFVSMPLTRMYYIITYITNKQRPLRTLSRRWESSHLWFFWKKQSTWVPVAVGLWAKFLFKMLRKKTIKSHIHFDLEFKWISVFNTLVKSQKWKIGTHYNI